MGFPLPMSEPLAAPVGVATEHTGPAQRSPRPPQRSPSGAPEGSSIGDHYRDPDCSSLHVAGRTLTRRPRAAGLLRVAAVPAVAPVGAPCRARSVPRAREGCGVMHDGRALVKPPQLLSVAAWPRRVVGLG